MKVKILYTVCLIYPFNIPQRPRGSRLLFSQIIASIGTFSAFPSPSLKCSIMSYFPIASISKNVKVCLKGHVHFMVLPLTSFFPQNMCIDYISLCTYILPN